MKFGDVLAYRTRKCEDFLDLEDLKVSFRKEKVMHWNWEGFRRTTCRKPLLLRSVNIAKYK